MQKGSRKPIRSRSFCERFQIDLIDFRKLQKRDPFGVLMRWILTVKDHATGFVYLCALPRKWPSLIAYHLQEIFGVMGHPLIFNTNNGKEFVGKSILKFLHNLNPNILTNLEEVDDDDFFQELETNDNMEVIKHYKTPVKPLDLPLLDVGSIIQMPTNTDVKEATESHDNVGDINIDMTLAVNHDHRGEVMVATIFEMDDKK